MRFGGDSARTDDIDTLQTNMTDDYELNHHVGEGF